MFRTTLIAPFVAAMLTIPALTAAPVAKTVPAFAGNSAIPHDALAERAVTLKGTSSVQGGGIQATWDFGDGSSPAISNVVNQFDVSATHVYSGPAGSVFSAKLTIADTATGESSSAVYRVAIRERTIETEVN